jgi:hypothetical protein
MNPEHLKREHKYLLLSNLKVRTVYFNYISYDYKGPKKFSYNFKFESSTPWSDFSLSEETVPKKIKEVTELWELLYES